MSYYGFTVYLLEMCIQKQKLTTALTERKLDGLTLFLTPAVPCCRGGSWVALLNNVISLL